MSCIFFSLKPTTKLGQGYIFTGVCDSVHGGGGGLPQCMLGYHPNQQGGSPWQGDPPPGKADPPGKETPSLARQTHYPARRLHPRQGDPPAQRMLGDTVNKRVDASYWNGILVVFFF